MIKINSQLLSKISRESEESLRKRINYNFHKSSTDFIQRFLNALQPATYLQPHKHENPDKVEIFILLTGKVLIVEFDDKGEIIDHVILDHKRGNFGVELPPKTWHSFLALESNSVLYEIKEGPYNPDTDKTLAEWAPPESTQEGIEFNNQILKKLHVI